MHYQDLTIRNFRGIKELTLPQLGRVNLLTGKNNTGKTSVLEALQLHAQNGSPSAIHKILLSREEFVEFIETAGTPHLETSFEISNLFRGFPTLLDDFKPVCVSANVEVTVMKLNVKIDWVQYEDSNARMTGEATDVPISGEEVPELRICTENTQANYRLDILSRFTPHRIVRPLVRERMPCQIVNPSSSRRTNGVGPLWDRVALTKRERDVVEALRLFDPNIEDFSMIGQGTPKAMVRVSNLDHPVPLSSFGDGMNRMLRIMLSLVNARGGILLVDEFENGLHYSVHPDAWRMVFKLAQNLDVQVFATTHSRDTISSFQEVAAETEDAGVLIRLNRRGDDIIPTVYSEGELAVADRHAIEVR